jgi:hypothetical protein
MASVVRLDDVFLMLDRCAAGHTRRASREYWRVTYNGKTYRALPLGSHGRRHNPEIESGHVRSLVRHLGIDRACADRFVNIG